MHENAIFKKETVQIYPYARFVQFISEMLFWQIELGFFFVVFLFFFWVVVFHHRDYTATYWNYYVTPECKKTISENFKTEYLI